MKVRSVYNDMTPIFDGAKVPPDLIIIEVPPNEARILKNALLALINIGGYDAGVLAKLVGLYQMLNEELS